MRLAILIVSLFLAMTANAQFPSASYHPIKSSSSANGIGYVPANSANWISPPPTLVSAALDSLASYLTSVSATSTARSAVIFWSVTSGSITTNSYLGRLGDTSATATSVSPVLIPCSGTVGEMRIQRAGNATATGTMQVYKSSGGSIPSYTSTTLQCTVASGTTSCAQSAVSIAVSAGDVLIIRADGTAWSTGPGTIALRLFCT